MKRKSSLLGMGILAAAVGVSACGPAKPEACEVVPPETWSAPEWEANAADALALRAQLSKLVSDVMRAAEEGTAQVDSVSVLTAEYEAGDPSLSSIANPSYDALVTGAFDEFVDAVAAGQQDLANGQGQWAPGAEGGIWYGNHAINEGGLELRQLIQKGHWSGAFYPYALGLTEGDITPATIDAIAAAWGADAQMGPDAERKDSASYAFRMGFYAETSEALIAARAYAADSACTAERDEALVTVFRKWELALVSRFVHYANASLGLIQDPMSNEDLGSALHELSEGLGLGLGFHGVAHPASGPLKDAGRTLDDAAIEDVMAKFGVNTDALGDSTVGGLIEDAQAIEEAVTHLESKVKEVYGLTDADLQSFRTPTEG